MSSPNLPVPTTECDADTVMREGEQMVREASLLPVKVHPLTEYQVTPHAPAKGRVLTSYDLSTREGKMGVYRATQRAEMKADDASALPIQVVHVVFHPVALVDREDGEIINATRTVLIGPDGKRLAMVSEGAVRQVMQLADILGPGPWEPPAKMRIRRVPTSKGFSTYEIDLID